MITPKIKNLFEFIDFLHSNIDNFNKYDEVVNEINLINEERKRLRPSMNFKDRINDDELREGAKEKGQIVRENILQPIHTKVTELNICNLRKTGDLYNWNKDEITQLMFGFDKDDLPEIFDHKYKYIEFRTKTNLERVIRSLLDELNETLKELFDYFKETDENEFEAFETKIIPAKSLKSDVMKLILGSQEIIFDPIRNGYYQGESQVLSMETKFDSFWFTMKMNPGRDIYLAGINELLSFKQHDFLKHEHYCKLLERFRLSAPEGVKKGLDWHDLNEWINSEINNTKESPLGQAFSPQPIVKQKPELKIDQIALKYAYEGLQITRENGNEIAKEYGHNSGEKLFQRFTYFSSSANRKGKPNLCTPKKLDNKIKLIESIIELLPTDKQERARDEVSILKKIYEAEYQ